jgi:tetratricopeptide (TPR) repeat protein
MPHYLLTGKDPNGRPVTEAVAAPSADEAVRRYKARGFADVVLHSDEVQAHLLNPAVLERLTPGDYLALGRVSRTGYLVHVIIGTYRQNWFLILVLAALLAGRRLMDAPWGWIDTLAVAMFAIPAGLVLFGELLNPGRKFERAMAYAAWARWDELLAALPAVRTVVPAPQYAYYTAKALAGLGRLDEALATLQPFAADPATPAWLYWNHLAEVFQAARLGDRAIECGEKSVEHAPDNPTMLVDLALALLRHRRDAARARPLLERARSHEISDLLLPFLLMAEGVLALEENRPEKARELLDDAARRAEPLRHTTALMGTAIDGIHTYLCLACAATSDPVSAQRHFRIAEPRLRAFRAQDLLEQCRAAVGERV